jgi:RNA polymerase sigma-70 factor (ECF subfamily)
VQLFADPPEPEAVQEEDSQSAVIDLDQALQSLMPAERLCVSLSHGAGWSHSEIAEQLRLPIGTVKSHIKRALDKLKTRLSDELPKSEGDT